MNVFAPKTGRYDKVVAHQGVFQTTPKVIRRAMSNISTRIVGAPNTLDYKGSICCCRSRDFSFLILDPSCRSTRYSLLALLFLVYFEQDKKLISPFHDIPLNFNNDKNVFNMVRGGTVLAACLWPAACPLHRWLIGCLSTLFSLNG